MTTTTKAPRAKITRIELVNHSMLSFTLAVPKGSFAEDFLAVDDFSDILNSATEGMEGRINTFATETELKVGDEIDTDGTIYPRGGSSEIESTSLRSFTIADHRDAE